MEQLKTSQSEFLLIYRVIAGDSGHSAEAVVVQGATGQEIAHCFDRDGQVTLAQCDTPARI